MPLTRDRSWAVYNDREIKGFFDSNNDSRWLSNYGTCANGVWFEGILYPTSENAYQAQKVEVQFRTDFVRMSPGTAKRQWLEYPRAYTGEVWDKMKLQVMAAIVFDKFYRNMDLRLKLLGTGTRYIEETNDWKDYFWGADPVVGGLNNLGKILMAVRDFWQTVTPSECNIVRETKFS